MRTYKVLHYGLNAAFFASIQLQSYNSTLEKIAYLRPWTFLFAFGSNAINIWRLIPEGKSSRTAEENERWENRGTLSKIFFTILGVFLISFPLGLLIFMIPYAPTLALATQVNHYLFPPKFALPLQNDVELSISPSFGYKNAMLASSMLNSFLSIASIFFSEDRYEKQDSTIILLANALSSYKATRWQAVTATIVQKIPAYNFGLFSWYSTDKVDQMKYNYTFQVLTDAEGNLFSLKADGSRFGIGAILQDFKDRIASFTDLPHSLSLKTSGTPKLFGFSVPNKHKPESLMSSFSSFSVQALLNGKNWIDCSIR
ncbi:MAG: hypothetical protein SNF33_08190 [Candidatus Algichlamydia australiensis]|nr:hypothetical protein [Chlamydiales bacterium]